MKIHFQESKSGFSIVELMVTIVIVVFVSLTAMVFFAKLINLKEREREDAYVREKLADFCGAYADMLSVGTSIQYKGGASTNVPITVAYRQETGGVSLETGVVSRVAYVASQVNMTNNTVDLNIEGRNLRIVRHASGNAALIPVVGDMVSCTIKPFNYTGLDEKDGYVTYNAALGYLEVKARYAIKNRDGESVTKTASVGRVVRLWNRE